MTDLRQGLLGEKKKLDTFDKIYDDCQKKIKKIKMKNDNLQKNAGTDMEQEIAEEVRRQRQFIEAEILQLKEQLIEMENKYRDTESRLKIKNIKAEAQKQIERNKTILKEFINISFLNIQHKMSVKKNENEDPEEHRNSMKQNQKVNRSSVQNYEKNYYNRYDQQPKNSKASNSKKQSQQVQAEIEIDYQIQQKILNEKGFLLNQVEKDAVRIGDIMNQIGQMVNQQGDQIDFISDQILRANKNVVEANDQLEDANTYQKKAKSKMTCIVIIIVLIVAVIAGLVIFFKVIK